MITMTLPPRGGLLAVLLAAALAHGHLGAQSSRASDWQGFSTPRFAQAEAARLKKDHDTALRLTRETLDFLRGLPKDDQLDIGQEGNVLHYFAWIYCGMGDSKNALQSLSDAVDRGFSGYEQIANEHELDPIRACPEFDAIALRARARYDYAYILQHAAPYESGGAPIGYTFADKTSPGLEAVLDRFNVAVIAGEGDDVSRVTRLMTWVHLSAAHDGSSSPAVPKDAVHLIDHCQRSGQGLNCRCLAIALNDLYLAAGFQSRFVACMPKNLRDPDCHVICSVFVPSLKKWVWMDPTFAGSMKDEKGTLLSIEEVRKRFVSGQPVTPAEGLDRNGKRHPPEAYLRYMKKNLYWFMVPIRSEPGYETGGRTGDYAALVPKDFQLEKPPKVVTSDPAAFWRAP